MTPNDPSDPSDPNAETGADTQPQPQPETRWDPASRHGRAGGEIQSALSTIAGAPAAPPPAPPPEPEPATATSTSIGAIVDDLLRAPAGLMRSLQERRGLLGRLGLIAWISMGLAGIALASFSGGTQLLWVPLKLAFGLVLCAAICFPSLYIFTSLTGSRRTLRETFGALSMGMALIAVLMVGFAPISWIFSQATSSTAFMGGLQLCFFGIAWYFGSRLIHRCLAESDGRAPAALPLWSFLFVLVAMQMTTTLRPLVGPDDGLLMHERQFFLDHWLHGGS